MTAINTYEGEPAGLESPGRHVELVVPDDSNDLTYVARYLLIATGGNIKITTVGGDTETIAVPAGYLIGQITRVWLTGTTASGISAWR